MKEAEHDVLDELLRHAEPRPVPGPDELEVARAAVRLEWQEATGRRTTRRRVAGLAIAAAIIVAVVASFDVTRAPGVYSVQVASIVKSFGPVYLLGEEAELRPTGDLSRITSGQTIVSGDDAGIALAWGAGGSVRVDQASRVRFTSDHEVFLENGRIYFDSVSVPSDGSVAANAAFTIGTEYGAIRHTGTQFMTEVGADKLIVSVREGEVAIDGVYHDQTISNGQQATFKGRQRPSILSISGSGSAWEWVERTTPAADVDGKTLHEFLVWVAREMGLELRFEGRAEAVAREAILKGTIDTEPAEALRLRLASAALDWRIEGGVIYIRD